MEAKDAQTIVNQIKAHIAKQGGQASDWYSGVTEDIEERLFDNHNVPKKNHWYAFWKAISEDDARAAEKALLNYGCDGGGGGGDEDVIYVYAYLKTSATNP